VKFYESNRKENDAETIQISSAAKRREEPGVYNTIQNTPVSTNEPQQNNFFSEELSRKHNDLLKEIELSRTEEKQNYQIEIEQVEAELYDLKNRQTMDKIEHECQLTKLQKEIALLKEQNTDLESFNDDLKTINHDFEVK